jgi:hypothetical protein
MDKDHILQAIENLLDSSEIPMKEYKTTLVKENGGGYLEIRRIDRGMIPHMYLFSEIFNSYTEDWYMEIHENHIHIIVR